MDFVTRYYCANESTGKFVVSQDDKAEAIAAHLFSGKGRFDFPDGSWYAGDWKDGKKHGQGIYHAADGTIYNGSFKNDEMDGLMVLSCPDGEHYEGSCCHHQ